MEDRKFGRRQIDRLVMLVALVGALGGYVSAPLAVAMYRKVSAMESRSLKEALTTAERRQAFDAFRSQLASADQIRDEEIKLIKKRLLQLEEARKLRRR